jgi:hypothetical protein
VTQFRKFRKMGVCILSKLLFGKMERGPDVLQRKQNGGVECVVEDERLHRLLQRTKIEGFSGKKSEVSKRYKQEGGPGNLKF